MRFPRGRILVFGKSPVPGRVKTRLAARIGARRAARLYHHVVRQTLATAIGAGLCPVELWCAPDARHPFFAACRRDLGVPLRVQAAGDLGARMHGALADALGRSDLALLIGADAVSLAAEDLTAAVAALAAGAEVVLGPAEDGGYVAIGLRRPRAALFRGVAWGGAGVAAATRRRARRLDLPLVELPPRWDLDRFADLRRLRLGPPPV